MWGTNSRDWKCVCGEGNFAKRDNCRKCRRKKGDKITNEINGSKQTEKDKEEKPSMTKEERAKRKMEKLEIKNGIKKMEEDLKKKEECLKKDLEKIEKTKIEMKTTEENAKNQKILFDNEIEKMKKEKAQLEIDMNSKKAFLEIMDNDENKDNCCVICMDREKTQLITNCKHLCFCDVCCFSVNKCPICRTIFNPNKDLMKIYNV